MAPLTPNILPKTVSDVADVPKNDKGKLALILKAGSKNAIRINVAHINTSNGTSKKVSLPYSQKHN